MRALRQVKEEKARFSLELLNSFDFVSLDQLNPYEYEVLENVGKGVVEMLDVEKGNLRGKPARELLKEL